MAIGTPRLGAAAANTSAGTTLAVAYPTAGNAPVAGDYMAIVLFINTNDESQSPPAGWTDEISMDTGTNTTPVVRVYSKFAVGGESGTVSCSTASATSQGRMIVMSGVDPTTPNDVAPTFFERPAANTTFPLASVTLVNSGVTLFGAVAQNSASGTYTPPSGPSAWTEAHDAATTTPISTLAYLQGVASGATGTMTFTSTSSTRGISVLLALRPGPTTTPVTATRATTWNTKAVVSGTRATTWDALAATSSTRATTWDVLTPATATRATTWDVLAAVSSTRATTWNVRAVATSTRATTWRVRSAVTGGRATSWDVLTPATGSRATTWRVLAAVSGTRATTWRVRATVTGTRATTWDALAAVSGTRATTWRVLAQATGQRATTWNVASSLLSVTSTRPTTWRVLARATSTRSTTWDVLAGVTGTRATSWRVRAPVTTSRATTWRALQAASATRGTTWRTLERIATSRSTTWNVAALPGGAVPNIGSVTVDPPAFSAAPAAPPYAAGADVAQLSVTIDPPTYTSEA